MKRFLTGAAVAAVVLLCVAAGRISEMTPTANWAADSLIEVSKKAGATYNSVSMRLENLFSNATVRACSIVGGTVTGATISGGYVVAITNSQPVYYAPVLTPDSQLTNYTLNATNAEYIINATNSVDIGGFTFASPANYTRFVGVTVTNFSGSDRTLRVNVSGSTLKWLGSAPARITNGYSARLVFQFLGDPNGFVIGAFRHEGN